MKCKQKNCDGQLVSKKFIIAKGDFSLLALKYKEEFEESMPPIVGYTCIECGHCYNDNFKDEGMVFQFLHGEKEEIKELLKIGTESVLKYPKLHP